MLEIAIKSLEGGGMGRSVHIEPQTFTQENGAQGNDLQWPYNGSQGGSWVTYYKQAESLCKEAGWVKPRTLSQESGGCVPYETK